MKMPLFQVDYHKYSVANWEEKKSKLKQWLDKRTMTRRDSANGLVSFWTDRFSENSSKEEFCDIFKEELDQIAIDLGVNQMSIEDIWSVKYRKGDFHSPHDHGACNYSFVLYVDYDEVEHTPTQFISPFKDTSTNVTWINTPEVKEGDIVIFPSNILHLTLPNKSDKIRTIVSIDISTIGNKPAYTEH